MAVDMFMKITSTEGDVEGESNDNQHGGEIDVLSWSWGMSQSGTTHTGKGGGAGKVNVQDLTFTKYVDRATPNLMKLCCKGTHIPEATLTVRKAGGDSPVEYVKILMKEALISSISGGGSGGEDRLTETVTLNFAEFSFEYTPQEDDGSAGASIPMGWNIAKNVEV